MAFLIKKILETEVGLIHVVSGIGGGLLMGASGGIGIAIESFQTGEECACTDVDRGGVVIGGGAGGELTEGMNDLLWRLHQREVETGTEPVGPGMGSSA